MTSLSLDDSPARVPFRTVLLSIVGLWLTYFLLTTLRGELVDLGFSTEAFWRRALATLAGAAITLGLWSILRLFDARAMWVKIVAALTISLPVALLIAQANQLVFASMEERVFARTVEQRGFSVRKDPSGDLLVDIPAAAMPGLPEGQTTTTTSSSSREVVTVAAERLQESYWNQIVEVAYGRYFMLLAWCALYLALLTGEKARRAERREQQALSAAKASELRSLRYQVNPHFLFNTLNSLSALVLTNKTAAAERMIQTISTFYRRSLADDPTSDVSLAEEIALQKLYLDIEGVRFPLRLVARYEIPETLADCQVPGMILQPLVENSVKHAVATSSGQVTITLAAREEYGRLVLTVADDGTPAPHAAAEPRPGYGIGLANVRERLEARFGNEATITAGIRPEGGYATELRLPLLHGHRYRNGHREAAE
ncbi:sensor histidine kinase [Alteraurantiacibacter buctensis]|nr:histidine kinase [Alteraurantiacibacter buctensis]